MKKIIKSIPIFGELAKDIYWKIAPKKMKQDQFPGSKVYWEERYKSEGDSGVGSYGKFAEFKAEIINAFVIKHDIDSIIEFGCGDGNQLAYADYPNYIGFDVSETVLESCKKKFKDDRCKAFKNINDYTGETAPLVLSLDVIYHLIEHDTFEAYMQNLFLASTKFVIIYASNSDDNEGYEGTHVKHRKFTDWIENNLSAWQLIEYIPNKYPYYGDYREGSFSDFYIYQKNFNE